MGHRGESGMEGRVAWSGEESGAGRGEWGLEGRVGHGGESRGQREVEEGVELAVHYHMHGGQMEIGPRLTAHGSA